MFCKDTWKDHVIWSQQNCTGLILCADDSYYCCCDLPLSNLLVVGLRDWWNSVPLSSLSPGFCFLPELRVPRNVSSHPPISQYMGRTDCVVFWPWLCSILPRTKWSFIDRWYQERRMYRRYFWTLPVWFSAALKENSSLKCFQFSRYCKSLSKVTQTNDTELSSKNILKQNTVWSNITRHGRETSLKFKILFPPLSPNQFTSLFILVVKCN